MGIAGSVVNVIGTFRLEYGAEYEYEFSKLSKRLGFRERMPKALCCTRGPLFYS